VFRPSFVPHREKLLHSETKVGYAKSECLEAIFIPRAFKLRHQWFLQTEVRHVNGTKKLTYDHEANLQPLIILYDILSMAHTYHMTLVVCYEK